MHVAKNDCIWNTKNVMLSKRFEFAWMIQHVKLGIELHLKMELKWKLEQFSI